MLASLLSSPPERLKPPPPLELLDVCGVSDPGDGFSYLELTSRRDDSSNLPEKDEVALLEEVHFVDDSQPGFAGAAGHWQRAGKTVLAFAHYNIRKGTLKVRGAYRPASKVSGEREPSIVACLCRAL